jgi:hypothetical protein
MDLQSLKNMLGYSNTTKHDDYLTEMLPIMIDYTKTECNNTFSDELPGGVKLFIAKAIEFNMNPSSLKGRTMGEVSYSYNTEFPRSITRYIAPYRKARMR